MKCPSCQFDNEPTARFCANCGGAIQGDNYPATISAAKISCPKCGTPNNPDSKFCENCGTRIGQQPGSSTSQALTEKASKKTSAAWWILPFLLGWVGGLVAWAIVRADDKAKARNLLILGIVMTFVWILLYVVLYWVLGLFWGPEIYWYD